jgi:hypothetical protein
VKKFFSVINSWLKRLKDRKQSLIIALRTIKIVIDSSFVIHYLSYRWNHIGHYPVCFHCKFVGHTSQLWHWAMPSSHKIIIALRPRLRSFRCAETPCRVKQCADNYAQAKMLKLLKMFALLLLFVSGCMCRSSPHGSFEYKGMKFITLLEIVQHQLV